MDDHHDRSRKAVRVRLIRQAMMCIARSIATAAVAIMPYPVIVMPVQQRWGGISDIRWAVVSWGRNVIDRGREDGRSDEGGKPEADPNADPAVCLGRGHGHQKSDKYRSASHPAAGPLDNTSTPRHARSPRACHDLTA